MNEEPTRRQGPVPESAQRVYVITEGEYRTQELDGEHAIPTFDLTFYLNRQIDQTLPFALRNDETSRALDAQENAIYTSLVRLRALGIEAMAGVICAIMRDAMPNPTHHHLWF